MNTYTFMQKSQYGLSLVELMVAMAIGLVLMLGATGVLLTNQQAFRSTESLGAIQENARVAIDLMTRDIRAAGGHPCLSMEVRDMTGGNAAAVALKAGISSGITINPGTNPGNRVMEQGAIQVITASTIQTITGYNMGSTTITATNDLKANDIVITCTSKSAYLLRVTSATPNSFTVSAVPGVNLLNATLVSGLANQLWYIGDAGRALPSLYRRTEGNNPEEMVDNVTGLAVQNLNGATKLTVTLCGRSVEQNMATAAITCPGRLERTSFSVAQRRTS